MGQSCDRKLEYCTYDPDVCPNGDAIVGDISLQPCTGLAPFNFKHGYFGYVKDDSNIDRKSVV